MNINIQFTSLKDVRRKKKNKIRTVINLVIIAVLIFNIVMLYVGNIYNNKFFSIDTKKELDQYESNKKYFSETRFNTLQKEEVSVASKNNYRLYGTYIKNGKPSDNTIILLHDLGGSRWTVLKYVDMYLDKGFNVLIYDGRAHGASGGDNTTYGYYEESDLDRWISWLYGRNKNSVIGVHGDSIGAATALLHAGTNETKKRVSFYIVDSPYSDLKEFFTYKMLSEGSFKFEFEAKAVLFYSDIINKLKNNFSFEDASPKNIISKVNTPVFFIHGENDNIVPKNMTEEMYNLKPGKKDIYIAPNSKHTEAYLSNPEVYIEKVYSFIDSVLNIKKDN